MNPRLKRILLAALLSIVTIGSSITSAATKVSFPYTPIGVVSWPWWIAKEAGYFEKHGRGEASDDELSQVQDESVSELIAKQELHGPPIITDGEYRRLNFQDSFVEFVSGFIPKKQTIEFQESRTAGGEALQRWQPDSAKTDPALQYWRAIAEATRYYPAKAQRR